MVLRGDCLYEWYLFSLILFLWFIGQCNVSVIRSLDTISNRLTIFGVQVYMFALLDLTHLDFIFMDHWCRLVLCDTWSYTVLRNINIKLSWLVKQVSHFSLCTPKFFIQEKSVVTLVINELSGTFFLDMFYDNTFSYIQTTFSCHYDLFLAHLARRANWAFLITWRPSSVVRRRR